jgi:chromosome segregation ATPase
VQEERDKAVGKEREREEYIKGLERQLRQAEEDMQKAKSDT